MESLIKQKRVRFLDPEQGSKEEINSIKETRIPQQKTDSFKEDRKAKDWFQRQSSGEMSRDYDSSDEEFATAIAAASFAVYSLEEANKNYQESLRKTRKEKSFKQQESNRLSRLFSGKEAKDSVEAPMRKTMRQDSKASHALSERTAHLEAGGNSTRRRTAETKADAWEKAAIEKIRKRYDKMGSSVLAWENGKKLNAKLQMERKKNELEQRRAINLQHYRNKLASIDHIAGGARTQIEEKRRNEESQVKERAKKIRSSGKVPGSCFCF